MDPTEICVTTHQMMKVMKSKKQKNESKLKKYSKIKVPLEWKRGWVRFNYKLLDVYCVYFVLVGMSGTYKNSQDISN